MFTLREDHMAALSKGYSARQLVESYRELGIDAEHRPGSDAVHARDAFGRITNVVLDGRGRISKTVTPLSEEQLFGYTGANQLSSYGSSDGLQLVWSYDSGGRPLTLSEGSTRRWRFGWDEFNNLTRTEYPDGTAEDLAWISPGLLHAYRNRSGGMVQLHRDELLRLRELVAPNGQSTRYFYGNHDRPSRIVRPDGSTEDLLRNTTGLVSAAWRNEAPFAKIEWTSAGKLKDIRYSDGQYAAFEYDGQGHVTQATNAATTVSRSYDDAGRILREERDKQAVCFRYDAAGSLTEIVHPSKEKVEFTYDADGRIETIRDWSGAVHTVERHNHGRTEVHRLASGVREERRFDAGLLKDVGVSLPAAGSAVMTLRMEYDSQRRVQSVLDADSEARRFQYDAEGRVAAVLRGSQVAERYAYDSNGNRQTGTCTSVDELLWDGTRRMTYDEAGNVATVHGPEGFCRYTYNSRNLLILAELPHGVRAEYRYDAFARRISKKIGPVETTYLWAGDQLLRECTKSPAGTSSTDYLFLPQTHTPYAMRRDGAIYHFHCDHLGTPRWLTDPSGQVVWSGTFESFGAPAGVHGSVSQPFRFPGHYYDEETGLHYNRARYYSPQLGRYMSRDPFDLYSGTNLYVYANNDPFNQVDPLGLLGLWGKLALATALVVVGVAAIVIAGPIVLAAVAATAVTSATIAAAGVVVAGGAALGAGIALGMAPDGCWPCQVNAMARGALAGAGAALAVLGAAIGAIGGAAGGALVLAGGGTLGGGAAAVGAGVSAAAAGMMMMTGAANAKGGGDGGDSSEPPQGKAQGQKDALREGGTVEKQGAPPGKKGAEMIRKSGGEAQAESEYNSIDAPETTRGDVRYKTLDDGSTVTRRGSSEGSPTNSIQNPDGTVTKIRY